MTKTPFRFKQFQVQTSDNLGMPISTDGVMLGAWAFNQAPNRILDVGTGSGLLSLMCAQRFEDSEIVAIDIEPHACKVATTNANNSPWAQRIQVSNKDIRTWSNADKFDAIICNPPYFNHGKQTLHLPRAMARHTSSLTHRALIECLPTQLKEQGRAAFILPISEGEDFIAIAKQNGWNIDRYCQIKPTSNKPVHRILFELIHSPVNQEIKTDSITICNQNGYSEEFIELTRAFYLKM
jgi:tRNA1Val (adenine37-N6)-methyltransferase